MDQRSDGVTLLGDISQYGLKHTLPECFVSVKLETYEENCSGSPSKQLLTAACSASSVLPNSVHQVHMATPMMQQTQPGNPSQSAQQPPAASHGTEVPHVSQADGIINRPPPQPSAPATLPSSHSFSHAHTRPSEIAWLSHTYVDQGTQHFHAHQMPYLSNDAAMLTSIPHPQIQAHEGSRAGKQITGARGALTTMSCAPEDNPSVVTSVSASEVGHSNAFMSYVINPQRGATGSGVFLLEPSRGLTTQVQTNAQEGNTNNEAQDAPTRSVDEVIRDPLSDSASTSGSPKPRERHLVSRSSQTIVTMSQIQDAPPMSDAKIIIINSAAPENELEDSKETVFSEADGEDSEGTSSMESECAAENLRRITHVGSNCTEFGSSTKLPKQQSAKYCRGQVNVVTTSIHSWNDQCNGLDGITKTHMTHSNSTKLKIEAPLNHKNDRSDNIGSSKFICKENDKPFRCDLCGKTYPSQQALVNHERYHRGERPYECETCHKAFATNSHLVTHRRTHTGERPFQCQLCQRCFADRSAFVKHERTHGPNGSIIKRYKCEECGSGFVDSCGLKKHIRIHTGERPYVCNVCEKTFSTSSTFVAHKRIHTGERPYNCESCDKMFITKSHLLTHRRTHTGEKPFTCSVCNRCFADGSSFRRHERLHTGENRHICMQCGRGFPSDSSLEKHKQTHVQTSTYSYVYENRKDLNCLTSQQHQQQNCNSQAKTGGRVSSPQEASSDVHVNRSNMCSVVASREVDRDSQPSNITVMVRADNGTLLVGRP